MAKVRVSEVLARVSQLAASQWGLLTVAQAECEQVPRYRLARLVDAGLLERVDHGVYAVTAAEPDQHRRLRAAWLALDPERTAEERLREDPAGSGVVSHTSAAGLYGLGDLLDDTPELTTTTRKQTRRGVRLHRADLPATDVTLVDGLPTTTVERTVADLLRDGHDTDHVATIVGEGVRRGMVDRNVLAAHLDPLAHRQKRTDGRDLAEHLLDLTGLSSAALARQVAASPVGKQLVGVGARSAVDLIVEALSKIDYPNVAVPSAALGAMVNNPHLAALAKSIDVAAMMPAVAQVAASMSELSPSAVEAIRTAQAAALSPAAEALIKAVQSVKVTPATLDAVARAAESVRDVTRQPHDTGRPSA